MRDREEVALALALGPWVRARSNEGRSPRPRSKGREDKSFGGGHSVMHREKSLAEFPLSDLLSIGNVERIYVFDYGVGEVL